MAMGKMYQAPAIVWAGPQAKRPRAQVPDQPPSYNSALMPWPVYLNLQNRFPQLKGWVTAKQRIFGTGGGDAGGGT